jgi:hypothetical protein
MALKAVVESLEGLPKGLRDHYREEEGRFLLEVEAAGGLALEDVNGLKSTLGKTRRSLEESQQKLARFGDLDPDRVKRDLARLEELSKLDPESEADRIAEGKIKTREARLLQVHAEETDGLRQNGEVLKGQLEKVLIDAAATKAIADHRGAIDLLLPHVRAQARLKRLDNGEYDVEVVDTAGNPRIGDGRGAPMSIPQLVQEMRESEGFARAFDGSGQSGGGTPSSGNSGEGRRTINIGDQSALNHSIEAIAKGEVKVTG